MKTTLNDVINGWKSTYTANPKQTKTLKDIPQENESINWYKITYSVPPEQNEPMVKGEKELLEERFDLIDKELKEIKDMIKYLKRRLTERF